jgi:mutual gliding-motility protein MglA
MAQLLFAKKQINVKIVYYGPALSGKTTCLEYVEAHAPGKTGDQRTAELDGECALILDYFPDWAAPIKERTVCLQLFTVPSAVFTDTFPHRLALQGADALIYVADSDPARAEHNLDVWRRLGEGLKAEGESLAELPVIFQWNRRDVDGAVPVTRLEESLNARGAPSYETVATQGTGVLDALKNATRLAVYGLESLDE